MSALVSLTQSLAEKLDMGDEIACTQADSERDMS